jgi:hypothetical protein
MQSNSVIVIFALLLYVPSFLWSLLSINIMLKGVRETLEYLRARGEDNTRPYIEPLFALGLILVLCPLVNTLTALLGAWAMYNQFVREPKPQSQPGAVSCR